MTEVTEHVKQRNLTQACKDILRKLITQTRIGGRHTPETYCLRWIRHLSQGDYRETIKDWEWCIKEGLVLTKPKPSDRHVSLNPRRLAEIHQLIK